MDRHKERSSRTARDGPFGIAIGSHPAEERIRSSWATRARALNDRFEAGGELVLRFRLHDVLRGIAGGRLRRAGRRGRQYARCRRRFATTVAGDRGGRNEEQEVPHSTFVTLS